MQSMRLAYHFNSFRPNWYPKLLKQSLVAAWAGCSFRFPRSVPSASSTKTHAATNASHQIGLLFQLLLRSMCKYIMSCPSFHERSTVCLYLNNGPLSSLHNLVSYNAEKKNGRIFCIRTGVILYMSWEAHSCINGPCQLAVHIPLSFTSGCAMRSAGTQQTLNRHSTGAQQSLIKVVCFSLFDFTKNNYHIF